MGVEALKRTPVRIPDLHWLRTSPMASFLFCTCDWTTSLTPSYTTDTLPSTAPSLHHPPGPICVILKNKAVCLPKSWNRQSYLLSPYARDACNTQGVSETGMDEARCVSHPCCWNGTELQHLATFLLWKTSEKSYHKVIITCSSVSVSYVPQSPWHIVHSLIK
jgi:hypothetical protein